jgi:SAM-dependent methyltransferase
MSAPDLSLATACRSCGGERLELILDLGQTPLANALLPADGSVSRPPLYPLTLVRCPDCALVQIGEIVAPERLFSDYVYFSSFSETMLRHAEAMAAELTARERLGPDSLVVELASNDGYLLQYFKARGVPVLGIEPAQNIAAVAEREKGIPTLARFFSREVGAELAAEGRRADVVIGNNVLAHVPDLNSFVGGVAALLKPTGVAVFEAPYLKEMLDRVEFDTIYHEHQCYFSATALAALFERHGLELVDVERQPIHGGSLRVFAAPTGRRARSAALVGLLDEERGWGVDRAEAYAAFADRVAGLKAALVGLLDDLRGRGKRVAAYGASAKGVTLLSYCGVGAERLEFVVDRSTYKQGHRYPAGGLPILAPEALLERRPDYALLLTWNFAEEILRQQAAYRQAGGRFVVPVPAPKVVE